MELINKYLNKEYWYILIKNPNDKQLGLNLQAQRVHTIIFLNF